MFASLQPYIDECLRRATPGKSSLGEPGVLEKAAVLSQLDVIVSRRCVELPVRCLALLRVLALRASGLSVDSEGCMMCGITLEAIPRRQFNGVPRVGCSVAIGSETVARFHEVKYLGQFLQVCYIQWQHAYRRGEARRECKE